jgi:hypothetical protein
MQPSKEEALKALGYICNELSALNENTGQDVGIETQLPMAKELIEKYIASAQSRIASLEGEQKWISVGEIKGGDYFITRTSNRLQRCLHADDDIIYSQGINDEIYNQRGDCIKVVIPEEDEIH